MSNEETMRTALEALENLGFPGELGRVNKAISALHSVLNEPAEEKAEPVAWVPVHPRSGPLWSMTTDHPDAERLPSYPLRELYFHPPRRELSEEVEAVIACLEDDAAMLRDQIADSEVAANMDKAAKLLRTMRPRRELSERDGHQYTHEARRWCSGDSAWSEWQPCTAEQAVSYAKDETFQVRAAGGEE